MPVAHSPLGAADAILALAALTAGTAVVWCGARRAVAPRPLAVLLGALALGGAARALAPVIGGASVPVGFGAAVLAWGALAALLRRSPPRLDAGIDPDAPRRLDAGIDPDAPRLLDAALSACGDGVAIAAASDDGDGVRIVYSNPAFEHLTGYSNDEAVGMSPSVLVDEPDALDVIRGAVRGTEPVRAEVPGRCKDGSRVWVEWQVVPVATPDGRQGHSIAVLRDVTQRRRADRELRASEARFRELFEQAADAILVLDRAGQRIIDANRRACQSLGYTRDELTALDAGDLALSGTGAEHVAGETATAESAFRRKDGTTFTAEIRYAVIEAGGRRLSLAMFRDVTRRRSAEQALREREQLLRDVIAHIPGGVFWKDRDSVYLGCNERVARDLGASEPERVVGRSALDLAGHTGEAALDRDCDRKVMETGQPILDREESRTRPDGTRATLLTSKVPLRDTRGRVVGVLGVYTDVTDRKRLEEQLRQAQKLEAIGRLAGGVAHDFNNLLTVIRGNAELLGPSVGGAGAELLGDLILASDRATALVRQLLMFSRRQPAHVEVLDLNEVVTALAGLLRRVLGERVAVAVSLAAAPVTVRGDRSHLEQVLMNLAVNARDAMPEGGTLTVRTEAGRFVRLIVADTGTGMTEEVKARIFEPFFTTKGPDKGTGLGLATVFGIVQQAGGHIEVESAPGAGTTFRVNLPVWHGVPSELVVTPAPRSVGRRAERPVSVLLVEDQDTVRKFARLALEGQRHVVIEAETGEAALDLVGAGARFDVLVSDVTMPGIDGRELAHRVRALRPDVGVVLMSGYAPDAEHIKELDRSVFLPKPFPPADLFAALSRALRRIGRPSDPVPDTTTGAALVSASPRP